MCAMHGRGHAFLGFEGASTMGRDAYGDTGDNKVPVAPGSSVSGLVDDEGDWNLGEVLLWRNTDVRASLRVSFTAVQTQCHEFTHAVPNEDSDVVRLA